MNIPSLVSADWLNENFSNEKLIILDATLPKPASSLSKNPNAHLQIKGACYFDIDHAFSKKAIDLPHMMCDSIQFEQEARSLGINKDSLLVVYDQHGVYSSPRAWWMIRSMGHENVAVLDGGLPEWVDKGYPTESKQIHIRNGNFNARFSDQCFVNSAFVFDTIDDPEVLVIDARSRGRFDGKEPEPRPGLRSGHIPNSTSLPFTEVIEGYRMKSNEELERILSNYNLEGKKLVFSCGSGLTACIILLAAHLTGYEDLTVYDGSWSEWGHPSKLPVASK